MLDVIPAACDAFKRFFPGAPINTRHQQITGLGIYEFRFHAGLAYPDVGPGRQFGYTRNGSRNRFECGNKV